MGKMRKMTVVAGPLVKEACYPLPNPRDSRLVRQKKKGITRDAQARMNLKYQWSKLELLLAANFRVGDTVLTLTFDDAHLPDSRSATAAKFKAFAKALREIRKPKGADLKYIYWIEHKHSRTDPCFAPVEQAQQGRWHIHMVINATGDDYADYLAAWGGNGLLEAHPFELSHERSYESLARYACKEEPDYVGARKFIPSRGLIHPEPEYEIVASKTVLDAPKGATVYDNTGVIRTEYGYYQYIKYLWPKLVPTAPKAKHRHRRKVQSGKRK